MFQFRRFPSYDYEFIIRYLAVGFPIRKSPDRSLFAAPRSLSQLITSFIGSWCQGIPLVLFLAWPSRIIHLWLSFELCRLSKEVSLAKIVSFTLNIFPLLLPSHNYIIISQCSVFKVHLRRNRHSFRFVSVNRFCVCRKLRFTAPFLLSNQTPLCWAFDWLGSTVESQRDSRKLQPSLQLLSISCFCGGD